MSRRSYPHHVSLYLSEEQHRQLRELVKRTGVDASKHLRRALRTHLELGGKRPGPETTRAKRAVPTGEVLPELYFFGD